MKGFSVVCFMVLLGLLLTGCAPTSIRPDVQDLVFVQQPKFIFKGTVVKLNAATMPIIEDTRNTAIVRVDEVYQMSGSLSDYTGKEITVLLTQPDKTKVGQEAVFFTNGWLYGKSIAVKETNNLEFGRDPARLREQVMLAIKEQPDRNLHLRLARAELVIVGQISSIQKPDSVNQRQRDTEHDPDWRNAVISIESVEKGRFSQKTITIWFPGSRDIHWYRAPKFRVRQGGIWILSRFTIEGLDINGYTALDPKDFHSRDQLSRIRNLLKDIK